MPMAGSVTHAVPSTFAAAPVAVSATLAVNEALAKKQRAGVPVLPLAFGEAGLPVHGALREALAAATGRGGYGPVAGLPCLREAAAGYWHRRGLETQPWQVVCGPGSKPLLFGLLLAIGGDVAVPKPSWVSYAAQANLLGIQPHFVPTPPGEGGIPDPHLLASAAAAARAAGREIRSVVLTLPDNPTGTLASDDTMRRLCATAAELGLIIISDEIYRDLVHDQAQVVPSPAAIAPERTVVTTALSKSLALGGWRIGIARLPGGRDGIALRDRLLGIGSEIWSTPSGPIQQAAAYAFSEPGVLIERIAASRRLHATVARAVAARFTAAGARVPAPQAAFYLYPDFGSCRDHLRRAHGVTTATGLSALLLDRYGTGVLPGSAFGDDPPALRLRVATGLLYGDTDAEREAALISGEPLALPWIASALTRLQDVLADLTSSSPRPRVRAGLAATRGA
jgi:aspartate/methionine/tyrosine aminotransferase